MPLDMGQVTSALAGEDPAAKARAAARRIEARRKGADLPCTREQLEALHAAMSLPLRHAARRERRRG